MREEHPIPLERLRLIRERGEGWEAAFWELWPHLEERVAARARSTRRLHDPHDVDDFVSEFMLEMQKKAADGLLLVNWAEDSSVLGFLAQIVPGRTLDFLADKSIKLARSKTGANGDFDQLVGVSVGRRLPVALQERLGALLENVRVEVPSQGGIKRPLQHLGIQFHPRIDWDDTDYIRLRDSLVEVLVCSSPGWPPRRTLLDTEHVEARAEIEARIDRYSAEMERLRGGRSRIGVDKLDEQIKDAHLDLFLTPISSRQLMKLLEISRDNADQLRSRLRKRKLADLPGLLELCREALELDDAGDEILDMMEKDS
jgi:hypothetical protein